MDWEQLTPGMGARLVPAMVLVLAAGLAAGEPAAGAVAAGGAYVVGLGAFQQTHARSRAPGRCCSRSLAPPVTATILGTLLGNSDIARADGCGHPVRAVLVRAAAGDRHGRVLGGAADDDLSLLVVAGAYPGELSHALVRASLVLAGGTVQLFCYAVIAWVERGVPPGPSLRGILRNDAARCSSPGLRFHVRACTRPFPASTLRVALALGAAVEIERLIAIPNGYWVALTTLILMRPDFQ